MIGILRAVQTDLSAALGELSAKLSFGDGITSADSGETTLRAFGRPLSPVEAVRTILKDVRDRGDEAVADYVKNLDGVDMSPEAFRVSPDELAAAYDGISQKLRDSLKRAADNIRLFQEHIKLPTPNPLLNAEGRSVAVRYLPLSRVGVYVPGGRAAYPSTVLMTAIPARTDWPAPRLDRGRG